MKKLAFLFALIISAGVLFGQGSKVQSALNYSKPEYNQLDKAKEAIDAATVHEKTMNLAKTWKVRGIVYQAIGQSQDEKFKTLCDNPLEIALESYLKAIELDEKGKMLESVKVQLQLLGVASINKGVEYFGSKDYDKALASFESSLKIDSLVDPAKVDSIIIFNTGIAADKAKNYVKASYYYSRCIEIGYEGSSTVGFLANLHKENGDTLAYVETLKMGFEKYPDDIAIIYELINYYLDSEQSDAALNYISKAVEKDPTNHTLYFAKGAIYDKNGDFDNAKTAYDKAVEIDSSYFNGYYNLGTLYFNKGVEMLKAANNIPANEQKKYDAAVKDSFKELEKALPYFEKAHSIDSTDRSTIITLKEIYFKLRSDSDTYMAKYNEFNEKVKALPSE